LARNVAQAQHKLGPIVAAAAAKKNGDHNNNNNNKNESPVVEYCQCELGDAAAVRAAFSFHNNKPNNITHMVFLAGGDGADYTAVNYRGVMECAQCCASCETIRQMVVISTAWATRPYSIAALLFNSLYPDSTPMAVHYLGEQELRRAAVMGNFDYVILRPGALKSDERYAKQFPEAAKKGLTYQQGDTFRFLYEPGRPGMSRSQLAHAVVAAVDNVKGRYTVEVTGSGTVPLDDYSVYQTGALVPDDIFVEAKGYSNDEIMAIHQQAVAELKNTALAVSLGSILLVSLLGWVQGMVSLLAVDAVVIFLWRKLYADRVAT
jgi:nucleoside-diphosphate-sugar epimerase